MMNIKHKKNNDYLIVIALLLIFSLQVISSINIHSSVWDEPQYIFHGYYFLKTGSFSDDDTIAPKLVSQVGALPLLFLDLDYEDINKRNGFVYQNKINSDTILFLSRLMMLFFYIPLGIYIFIWSKKLFGRKAALFALFLFAFSPNLIAHSKFVTQDIPVTSLMFIATYHFWRFMKRPSYKTAIISGITLGLALIIKLTALLLVPIFFILFIREILLKNRLNIKKTIRDKKVYQIAGLCIIGLIIAGFLIPLDYKFIRTIQPIAQSIKEDPIIDPNKYNVDMVIDNLNPTNLKGIDAALTFFFYKMPPLLPYDYLRSIFINAILSNEDFIDAFIMGKYSMEGWWYYYLVAFLIKTPIPTIIFLLLALVFFFISKKKNKELSYIIMPPLIILCFFSFVTYENVGLRHILAIYPFMFVFISNIINFKIKKLRLFILLLGILYVISAAFIYPYHFSYFNELIGGPKNGHKFLVADNLDSGQDIKGLAEYIKKNNIKDIKISFFNIDPAYYGIKYEDLGSDPSTKDCTPQKGLIAISATNLEGVYFDNHHCFDWLKKYKPIDHIGYSVYIYDIK